MNIRQCHPSGFETSKRVSKDSNAFSDVSFFARRPSVQGFELGSRSCQPHKPDESADLAPKHVEN